MPDKKFRVEAIDGTDMAVMVLIDRQGRATIRGTVEKPEMLRLMREFMKVIERSIEGEGVEGTEPSTGDVAGDDSLR